MIRQDEDLWMKKMREVLKDYSEPPAPNGWSKLEKELSPVTEKRFHPYAWWSVAATLILAISGISLFFMQSLTADDIRHTMPSTFAVTSEPTPQTKKPEALPTEPYTYFSDAKSTEKSVEKTILVSSIAKQIENEQGIISEDTSNDSEKVKIVTNETEQKVDIEPNDPLDGQSDDRRIVRPSSKDKLHLPVTSKKKRSSDGKWSVAASYSNAAGGSTQETQGYMSMVDATLQNGGYVSSMISINDKNELFFDGGIPYLRASATVTEIKHKQPVSFGLSVRKNLSNGFSVETGVTYTMLSSEGKSVNNASEKIEQKLHYIGVPVRGNWNFVESKRFTVYLTAGGMVEKCVYGKVGSEKETVKPLQFSLAGGVGGQLNLTDRIGIYIEPGASYFFDDGSDVETIRKENPLNFNLQGGIRFTY